MFSWALPRYHRITFAADSRYMYHKRVGNKTGFRFAGSRSATHSWQLRHHQNPLGRRGIHTPSSRNTDLMQGDPKPHPKGCKLVLGRGQRHTTDAVPDHCSSQARLPMYCVWHSIKYQLTTTGQHAQYWIGAGIRCILYQHSFQYVHGGQRTPFEECQLKLSMHCYLKTRVFTNNLTYLADPVQLDNIDMIPRDTASFYEWANVWSQEELMPNSLSIEMLKEHMLNSTLTDLSLTREWVRQQSSTTIFQNGQMTHCQLSKTLPR